MTINFAKTSSRNSHLEHLMEEDNGKFKDIMLYKGWTVITEVRGQVEWTIRLPEDFNS